MFSYNADKQLVRQELSLEQQFALMAADENPDRAIKMVRDSLAKGVSYSVLPLLKKLNKKMKRRPRTSAAKSLGN